MLMITNVDELITHNFPSGKTHPQCKANNFNWCNTAYGKGGNQSICLNSKYPTGRGLAKKFESHLFTEHLTDDTINSLLKYGCTSLNESVSAIINWYADKKRHIGQLAYKGAVARGVC